MEENHNLKLKTCNVSYRTYKSLRRRGGILMACTNILWPRIPTGWKCGDYAFVCLERWYQTPLMIQVVCEKAFVTTPAGHLYSVVVRCCTSSVCLRLRSGGTLHAAWVAWCAKKIYCCLPTLTLQNRLVEPTMWSMTRAGKTHKRTRYASDKSYSKCFLCFCFIQSNFLENFLF